MPLESSPELTQLIQQSMNALWWEALNNPENRDGFVYVLGPELWKLYEASLLTLQRFNPTEAPTLGEPPALMFRGVRVARESGSPDYYIRTVPGAVYDRARAAEREVQARLSDTPRVSQWPEA